MLITFCLPFLFSLILTRLLRGYALRRNLIDLPGNRSSHEFPTPRGGGLSIVITFIVGLIMLVVGRYISHDLFLALCGGGSIAAVIGFIDDHRNISAKWRIVVHFIAATWSLFWLGGMFSLFANLYWNWIGNLIGVVGLVWLLNLYNFMDGIDGIAGVEAIFVLGCASIIFILSDNREFAVITGLGIMAVAGFLIWNVPPAKIFMGDVGSGFLGIVVGIIAIASIKNGLLPIWSWVILLGVFIIDSTVTLVRRMLRGMRWYEAHRSHAYQHAARRWKSHGRVILAITCINIFWLFPFAMLAWLQPRFGIVFVVIAYVPLLLLVIHMGAGIENETEFASSGAKVQIII